jgi:O-acetyl-ADP-ribose deacetylase (regulator of RNase III)
VYAYPVNEAARIALKTAMDYLKEHSDIERVRFVLFGQAMFDIFAAELKKLIEVEI